METRLSYRDISSDDESIKLEVMIDSGIRVLSTYSIHHFNDHNFHKFYFIKNRSSNPIKDPSGFIDHLKQEMRTRSDSDHESDSTVDNVDNTTNTFIDPYTDSYDGSSDMQGPLEFVVCDDKIHVTTEDSMITLNREPTIEVDIITFFTFIKNKMSQMVNKRSVDELKNIIDKYINTTHSDMISSDDECIMRTINKIYFNKKYKDYISEEFLELYSRYEDELSKLLDHNVPLMTECR